MTRALQEPSGLPDSAGNGRRPEPPGFLSAYPGYRSTALLDWLRATEYSYLDAGGHVYLDYTGAGLPAQAQLNTFNLRLHRCKIAVWPELGSRYCTIRAGSETGSPSGCWRRRSPARWWTRRGMPPGRGNSAAGCSRRGWRWTSPPRWRCSWTWARAGGCARWPGGRAGAHAGGRWGARRAGRWPTPRP